jgi:hypothetical protein
LSTRRQRSVAAPRAVRAFARRTAGEGGSRDVATDATALVCDRDDGVDGPRAAQNKPTNVELQQFSRCCRMSATPRLLAPNAYGLQLSAKRGVA